MNERQPYVMLVFGTKGVGKTHATLNFELKNYIKNIGEQQARPVIILDVQGEFSQFKAIKYDVTNTNRTDRVKNIVKINTLKRANIYRILAKHSNNIIYSKNEILQACYDIVMFFKNGLFLMEDINRYMTSNIPDEFYSTLISVRHLGLDLIMHYQKVSDPPPRIVGNANYIRLHKTGDSVLKKSTSEKFTNPELMRVAEIMINEQYIQGNIYEFIYIDNLGSKLLNVDRERFREAMRTYLYENHREVSLLMRRKDEHGKSLFKTENDAINYLIKHREVMYIGEKEKTKIKVKKV